MKRLLLFCCLLSAVCFSAIAQEFMPNRRKAFAVTKVPSTLKNNLKAYWKFEADGTDSHGTYTLIPGTAPAYVAGKNGNGADFEYSSSTYITNSTVANLASAGDKYSVACWFKPESIVEYMQICGQTNNWSLECRSASYPLRKQTPYNLVDATGVTLTAGTWYFGCAGFDGTKQWVYIGTGTTLNARVEGVSASYAVTTPFRVGVSSVYGTVFFDGIVDELAYWTRSLTDAEVTELFNGGAGKFYDDW